MAKFVLDSYALESKKTEAKAKVAGAKRINLESANS